MPTPILTPAQIEFIEAEKAKGKSNTSIAKELSVSITTVWRIVNKRKDLEQRRKGNQKRRERFLKAKAARGNKCSICGYNKSMNALSFHHVKEKSDFLKVHKHFDKLSAEALEEELKKCILVCANCHSEIHDEIGRGNKLVEYFSQVSI